MSDTKNTSVVEIVQGEWTYLTKDDPQRFLATGRLFSCTAIYGRSVDGEFAFMAHFDLPWRMQSLGDLRSVIEKQVPKEVPLEFSTCCCLKYPVSCFVRKRLELFVNQLRADGFNVNIADPISMNTSVTFDRATGLSKHEFTAKRASDWDKQCPRNEFTLYRSEH